MRFSSSVFPRFGWLSPVYGLIAMAVFCGSAQAACGDDVDGVRVPCACGDVVVSDVRLADEDPVVRERCSSDGLLVRAANDAASIRVDLDGNAIVGLGGGTGIRVLRGGRDGAVIVGGTADRPGQVAGFRNGVRASGTRAVAEIRNLNVTGNTAEGIVVRGDETSLVNVVADKNGRDGLRVSRGSHRRAKDGAEAEVEK